MRRAVAKNSRDAFRFAESHFSQQNRHLVLPRPTSCLASLTGHDGTGSAIPQNRLQSLTATTLSAPFYGIQQDFSSGLIPLYPFTASTRTRATNTRIGIRSFTTDSNQSKKPPESTTDATPQEHTSNTSATTSATESAESSSPLKLQKLVGSVGKQVNDRLNAGDLMSVYGIVTLIAIVLVSPYVVRQMRNSDSTYEEDFDGEDPVAEMARVVRQEFGIGKADGDSSLLSSVGVGGFDSIVADLLTSPRVQQGITELVAKVLNSPEFKRTTQVLLRELWNDLVNDPETLAQVIHLLQNVIQDENIKEAAIQLVMEVFNDKEVLDELVTLLERLGQEKEVLAATQALLVESAHNALNDPEILDHSMEFATDVVGDDVVQQTAGEALYNTFSYAVRPTLSVVLSIVGAGLILLSISAFRNAYSSERSIDDTLAMAFQNSAAMISRIVALPKTLLVACKNAIVSVLLFPFRLVAAALRRLGAAGNATLNGMNRFVDYMASLPFRFYQALTQTLQNGFQVLVGGMQHQSRQFSAAISTSFLGVFYRNLVEMLSKTMSLLQQKLTNMKTIQLGASSAVDDIVKGTIESFRRALFKTVATCGNAQQSLDQGIVDTYDQLYKITTLYLEQIVDKTTSTFLFQRFQEKEQLVKLKDQTIRGVSSGHKTLNHWVAEFGFLIEQILASVTGGDIR